MGIPVPEADHYPSGGEFIDTYLSHLEIYLRAGGKCTFLFGTEVLQVSKHLLAKSSHVMDGTARARKKFAILSLSVSGEESINYCDAVIDASGTYGNPNFAGVGGMPAIGELGLRRHHRVVSSVVDLKDITPSGSRKPVIAIIGSGTSAVTSLKRLSEVECRIVWITRGPRSTPPFTYIENDPLPQRHELYLYANNIALGVSGASSVDYICNSDITKFEIIALPDGTSQINISLVERESTGDSEASVVTVDYVISNCGYRPDMTITRELQVHYCWASEGPMKLAAAMLSGGSGGGDCLAQKSTGPETLRSPEPNFYIVGMKSYGRGSAFLLRIGYDQVDGIVSLLETERNFRARK